jgi:hypothetical protein
MRVEVWISWRKPNDRWVRLNIYGADIGGQFAGCGGIIRGTNGQWLVNFSLNLGRCNAYISKSFGGCWKASGW